jgi:hypothetical protein
LISYFVKDEKALVLPVDLKTKNLQIILVAELFVNIPYGKERHITWEGCNI